MPNAPISGVIQLRRPITVTATSATLDGPDEVLRGATFEVAWTGPNGPSDYVTIVPLGSPEGTYLSYANTNAGSPASLTAPADGGNFELWYVVGQDRTILARVPIMVKNRRPGLAIGLEYSPSGETDANPSSTPSRPSVRRNGAASGPVVATQ